STGDDSVDSSSNADDTETETETETDDADSATEEQTVADDTDLPDASDDQAVTEDAAETGPADDGRISRRGPCPETPPELHSRCEPWPTFCSYDRDAATARPAVARPDPRAARTATASIPMLPAPTPG